MTAVEVIDREQDGDDHEIVTLRVPVRRDEASTSATEAIPPVVASDDSLFAFASPSVLSDGGGTDD